MCCLVLPPADLTIEKGGTLVTPPRIIINNTLIDNYGTWLGVRSLSIVNSGRLNVRTSAAVVWNNSVLPGPADGVASFDSVAMRAGTLFLETSVAGFIRNVSATSGSYLTLGASATCNASVASFSGSSRLTLGQNALMTAVASTYSATGLLAWNTVASSYIVPGTLEFMTSSNAVTADNATMHASEHLIFRSPSSVRSTGTVFLTSPKVVTLESGTSIDGSATGYTGGNGPGSRGAFT